MTELSLNILDIAHNSISAKANLISVEICADTVNDLLTINIIDNGRGMSEDFLNKVSDPFSTTRTTRKVGMGIPLFKMATEQCLGAFEITSKLNEGTTISASFKLNHIDRAPLGNIGSTFVTLINAAPACGFSLKYKVDGRLYVFDTEMIEGIDLNIPTIAKYVEEMINENILEVNGGITI